MSAHLPNLFVIGAPKCGTTSLAHYLSGHPNVFVSHPKEPLHYNADIHHISHFRDKTDYLGLFREVGPEHRIVAEASVWYLYSREAVPAILADVPEARFVVMLRNPVDMACSLHDEMVFCEKETETDFIRAWRLQGERREGRSIPTMCEDVQLILYRDACSIGSQLGRVMTRVPRERLHTIFFDDLAADPRGVWCDLLAFLGLPDDGRTEFPAMNAARTVRSARLKRALSRARSLKRTLGLRWKNTGLLRPLAQWNRLERRREPLPTPAYREILADFLAEIEQIETLTGRDLSGWKKVS